MLLAGVIGVVTAAVGLWAKVEATSNFICLWLGAAALAVVGAFLLARRQAINDKEAFWSGPTKRVTQALSLPLLTGLFLSLVPFLQDSGCVPPDFNGFAVTVWILFYGFALFTAGFFMPRAIKAFGTLFVLAGCAYICAVFLNNLPERINAHLLMGFFFGVLHLALGAYLYLTERKNSAA
jgi:hypothetical protein